MLTLTKNIIREIRSLEQRKGRREQQAWLAEGNKMVSDLLTADTFTCLRLIATADWWQEHSAYATTARESFTVTRSEMERVSLLQAPQDVLAVFALPHEADGTSPAQPVSARELCLLLDCVQDPGNMGTIIRTADWFGVRRIYCSPGTADCFSPKVVQATMSALARVRVHYFDDREQVCRWLHESQMAVYGTFLEGENIYQAQLTPRGEGVLVMGNEGRGVGDDIASYVTRKLLIPSAAADGNHVESLNVSVATGICLNEFCRVAR